jgi:hypothetical protein
LSADVSYIGWWGVRAKGKWHLVESEVTDRLVMRCGRQMPLVNAYGALSFQLEPNGEKCEPCVGRLVND